MNAEYILTRQLNTFLYGVYGWMSVALMITGITAYTVAQMPGVYSVILTNPIILIALFIAQIALVMVLRMRIMRMSFVNALSVFLLYAVLLGITLSVIFLVYTQMSIVQTFFVTASMFGVMAVYGYTTQSDLSSIGNIAFMMLIGLIVAQLMNLFIHSTTMDLIISLVGVGVFTLLTAFDVQRIKNLGQQLLMQQRDLMNIALLGALMLYLDFINLFLFMLRLMGRRRD